MKTQKTLKIGIVGCGAIGRSLSRLLDETPERGFEVVAFSDVDLSKAETLRLELKRGQVVSLEKLVELSDLVVEAASAKAAFEVIKAALKKKKDVLIMSIGGVLGKEKELFEISQSSGANVYFPSGAICGLDGIRALSLAGIDEITLKTLKPPAALKGADYIREQKIDLDVIKEEKVIFQGSASEAVRAFPQNINVVALLSLAARGEVVPQVRIVVSPGLKRNVHMIEVKSKAAHLKITCENVPSPDNPKTSYLAILAALATILKVKETVCLGT
jgi:aspartate dehydrogenase